MATQKPPNKSTKSPDRSNVHPLKPSPTTVQLPEGWVLEGPFGHMAFEPGDSGRLARLAEVVKWIQTSEAMPRSEAVELLCERMPADVMTGLYQLAGKNKGRAKPVPVNHLFGYKTAEQIDAEKAIDRQNASQARFMREREAGRFGSRFYIQNGRIGIGYPAPSEPGRPALLRYLRACWIQAKPLKDATCDILDDLTRRFELVNSLAIPLDKACALWGYGRVVADTAPPVMSR